MIFTHIIEELRKELDSISKKMTPDFEDMSEEEKERYMEILCERTIEDELWY